MDIKYILEALRQKPTDPGVYRDPGQPVRRQGGSLENPIRSANRNTGYARYKSMQTSMGESPVSYEEWLVNHAS